MKEFQNLLMLFWFVWFALAGIIFTGMTSLIIDQKISLEQLITTGAFIGICIGGFITITLYYLRCYKQEPQQEL